MEEFSKRKPLPHDVPPWVPDGAIYFVTICTRPRGVNQLCQPGMAARIQESMEFRQARGDWWLYLALLMPDHLHALMMFPRERSLHQTLGQWKRYAAREFKVVWQADYFEHRLRNDESLFEKAHYICMNPVRAGLVGVPEEWPYVWPKQARRIGPEAID